MEHNLIKQDNEVESLMELVELINAKGDQGEIEEIMTREEDKKSVPSTNCGE